MKNTFTNLSKHLPKLMLVSATIQILMCLLYTIVLRKEGAGDESHFIAALNMIDSQGWANATRFGISIPYLILVMPLHFIMPSYLALRITNLILLVLFFGWYLFLKLQLRHTFTLSILISYIATTNFYLFGTNDALFTISLAIFFIETYYLISNKSYLNPVWALLGLCVAFFTRELFLVFLPAVILSLFIAWRHKAFTRKAIYIVSIVTIFFIMLNGYALKQNNRLSYDNKIAPNGLSWTQRNYLSQLEVNKGKLQEGKHVSWDELRAYLNTHGENSLPKSIGESIFFDLKFTLYESIKNLKSSVIGLFRQMGLLLIFPLVAFFLFTNFQDRNKQAYLIALLWGTLYIFCVIIIYNIELRWLGAVVLTYLVASSDYYQPSIVSEDRKPIFSMLLVWMQLIFVLLSLYGIAKYSKLIL
jgi:hypothetical protein